MDRLNLAESLNPQERKLLPLLKPTQILEEIKTDLTKDELLRTIQLLENKKIITTSTRVDSIISNIYTKEFLPEIRFLKAIESKPLPIKEIKEKAELDSQEFSVSMGGLKRNSCIHISKENIEITKEGREYLKNSLKSNNIEKFGKLTNNNQVMLRLLPKKYSELTKEEESIIESMKKRGVLIKIKEKKVVTVKLEELGKQIQKIKLDTTLIETLTPNIIKNYQGQKFRRYDIQAPVPKVYPGRRHFVNEAIGYARSIWLELGFKEMKGSHIQPSFWNFDALFVPQDHPAREMQDTFFLKNKTKSLPKEIVERVKKAHEEGVDKSTGWQYAWSEEEAKRLVLRTHTTSLSALTLASLTKKELPAKYFTVGKCYRNETLDWSHLFEFNQTEGIVVDPDANFRHLLGYLKEFFKKMGYDKARFRPAYFPYTEMSVEIEVFHPIKKKWLELGGAGMFRPEVVYPLLKEDIPVLAWGPGFDRIILDYYQITDIRELYQNNLKQLREIKLWLK